MVEILLILFAIVAYYVALHWIYDGCKKTNRDPGGKVFGGFIFLVATGLVVCYFYDFLYPVIVFLSILSFIFIVIGLDFLSENAEVFFGSSTMFGILCWIIGLMAVYPSVALMMRVGWYTVAACAISGAMVILALLVFKRFNEKRKISYSILITFVIFLLASFYITNQYLVSHFAVVITDVLVAVIIGALMCQRSKSLELST